MSSPDKVAVVTGSSRGIGRGIVRELARLGWSIVINYRTDARSAEEARGEAEELGAPKTLMLQADVSDRAASQRLIDDTLNGFGRLDLLVNNAGVAPTARVDLLETTLESWEHVTKTNLRGPFFLTQYAAIRLLELLARKVVDQAQIVFISSISSVAASTNRAEYCVAKAALSMVSQLFAARLAGSGILVHEIRPGLITTDMTAGVAEHYDRRIAEGLVPLGRWGTPEDVGRSVAAIACGSLSYSTGNVVYVDGGMNLRRL
jgi:NAD(P)-dependent dehydrogenase (short-subunit alcohol dehydrogenase family)